MNRLTAPPRVVSQCGRTGTGQRVCPNNGKRITGEDHEQDERHRRFQYGFEPNLRPSENPDTRAVAGTHGLAVRTLLRSVVLAGVGWLAIAGLVDVARPAAAAPVRRSGGIGTGTPSVVDFSEAARSPDARTPPPANPRIEEFQRRSPATLPSRPTSGTRKVPPAAAVPHLAPTVASNFDGISEARMRRVRRTPDPNAATSGTEIVELVNTFIQVTDTTGAVLCGGGVTLNRLLRSTDSLTDPRVQFDNVHQRFSLAVTVAPASKSATPAMWVAASDSADACGTWRVYRLTFSGSPFPAGTFLDFPMLGQDTNALLISTRNLTPTSRNFTVFGLPKAAIYAGAPVSFSTFNVPSLTAPITNAGQPMISSPFSFFLAAVPGTGYRLFRLTNSGGPGATLTLQATIHSPFKAPTREANQPGTSSTVDSSTVTSSPRPTSMAPQSGSPTSSTSSASRPCDTAPSTSRPTRSQRRWHSTAAPVMTSIHPSRWASVQAEPASISTGPLPMPRQERPPPTSSTRCPPASR